MEKWKLTEIDDVCLCFLHVCWILCVLSLWCVGVFDLVGWCAHPWDSGHFCALLLCVLLPTS